MSEGRGKGIRGSGEPSSVPPPRLSDHGGRPFGGATHTYTTLFGGKQVDETAGKAYQELESDFEKRKEYMSDTIRQACEHRLALLRHTWALLLDPAPEQ